MRALFALLVVTGIAHAGRGRTRTLPVGHAAPEKHTIRKRIKQDLPAIVFCFEQHDTTFPRLEVAFTIGLRGTVTRVVATGGSKELKSCVTRVFKKMTFPKSAASTQVTYPLQICSAGQ